MIVTCPSCNAGHSVPASTIPPGGLAVTCRRCNEAFYVRGPDLADLAASGPAKPRPPAGGGSIRPEKAERPTLSAPPIRVDSHDSEFDETVRVDLDADPAGHLERVRVNPVRSRAPEPARSVPPPIRRDRPEGRDIVERQRPPDPGPSGVNCSSRSAAPREASAPEVSEVSEVSAARDTLPPPRPPSPKPPEPMGEAKTTHDPLLAAPRPADAPRPREPDLYERMAAGEYVPEASTPLLPPKGPHAPNAAWNEDPEVLEPSGPVATALSPFRALAMTLNAAPLALKVALVVLPAALGGVLFAISTRSSRAPIRVPVNTAPAERAQAAKASEAAEQGAVKDPERSADESARPARAALPGDEPAPEGHSYVQVERARLKSQAGDEGQVLARLELGKLVKRFDKVGDWVLVMAVPEGPAGFVSEKLLGPRKPIAVLARDRAFQGCAAGGPKTRDDCLYASKQQLDACLERCGSVLAPTAASDADASPAVRCADACQVAAAECQRGCTAAGGGVEP